MSEPVLESVLVCPGCGHAAAETMPADACVFFYKCEACNAVLQPLAGDCCVFCSYGTVPCPPAQRAGLKAVR
ncbi:MAG TPA: GDCCVxC domain-containing (seleno)protein [Burkholderiales bacterium]|jgi:hypothetical protein|nr:GDCCVxC domain-containing (seleno)protein [Burkholderiales bacterium]